MQETRVRSSDQEDAPEKGMATTPVILPGEFHGQRSLVGYSPLGHKQLDTTERLTPHLINMMSLELVTGSINVRSLVGCSPWGS